jgi:hypothetical protein
MRSTKCIVVFDNQDLCVPLGWDDECEGALEYSDPVVVFPNRKAARRAISVSKKYAALCKAQGKPANSDFLPECADCIKIVRVVEEGAS